MLRTGWVRLAVITASPVALAGLYRVAAGSHISGATLAALGVTGLGLALLDLAVGAPRRLVADFRAGRYDAGARGADFLLRWTRRPARRARLQMHAAACHLAAGRRDLGLRLLRALDRETLPAALRPLWLNNYAYGLLLGDGDPAEALRLCDEATAQQPDNPAIRSTRGIALLRLGRLEDAIAELQASLDTVPQKQGPAALAENYYHLARAWELRGEAAYARDHYLKSLNLAPDSPFGRRSAERLRTTAGENPAAR